MNSLNNLIEKYKKVFNKEPNIIGIYFDNPKQLFINLNEAIKNKQEYNEYELLSKEQKDSFKKGNLLF